MLTLDDLTDKISDLPPLPDIVIKLMRASRDPEADLREMVQLIKLDPALTAKVLRLCNSAYFGLVRRIESIREALVYIGTNKLVDFIITGCMARYYEKGQDGYGLKVGELWSHCVGCAYAAQYLSPPGDETLNAEAFTAGLLHDIGKIILNTYVGEEFDQISQLVMTEEIPFDQAEREILGFSHTDAGAHLAEAWNLPESIHEAIAYHQIPHCAKRHPRLVAQVHLANIMCQSFGIGLGYDGLAYTFHPGAMTTLDIEISDLYRLSIEVHAELSKARDMIDLAAA